MDSKHTYPDRCYSGSADDRHTDTTGWQKPPQLALIDTRTWPEFDAYMRDVPTGKPM